MQLITRARNYGHGIRVFSLVRVRAMCVTIVALVPVGIDTGWSHGEATRGERRGP